MGRRTLFVSGVCLVLFLAGVAGVYTNDHGGVAAGAPSTPPVATSTPADPDQPSPGNGLGNTRATVERVIGQPTGLQGTMLAYQGGKVAVSYQDGRASGVLLSLSGDGATIERARQKVQALLPTDRILIGTMKAGTNRVADIYQSARLGAKITAPNSSAPAGQFVVIYEDDGSGTIRDALMLVGDVRRS